MRVFSRIVRAVCALCCLSSSGISQSALPFSSPTAASDSAAAQQILGANWQQLSRRAGMIFAGTVLSNGANSSSSGATAKNTADSPSAQSFEVPSAAHPSPGAIPSVEFTFHVDEAIAGVERGQTLTIREWAGVASMQRPMLPGQRVLLFLYPPSRLGLTSPVDGAQGQIFLYQNGTVVSQNIFLPKPAPIAPIPTPVWLRPQSEFDKNAGSAKPTPTTLGQIYRAIRALRANKERQ